MKQSNSKTMRTIRIKLFKFIELTTAAKQTAIKNYRKNVLNQWFTSPQEMPDKEIVQVFDREDHEFTKEGNHFITPSKKIIMGSTMNYREKEYTLRTITYHPKEDKNDLCTSLVSTDELSNLLYEHTQSKNESISSVAQKVDEQIAFFLPEGEIKGTTPDFVKKCLNDTFTDFKFIDVI